MRDSVNVDKTCASALLDAWARNDSDLMGELAALAHQKVNERYVNDPAESERLELLGAIAVELHRACSLEKRQEAAPYVRLLFNLVSPARPAARSAHAN